MRIAPKKKEAFIKAVWAYYENNKRKTLPWRRAITPYKIFVSEIMLQQTQVDRVIPFFNVWIKKFPTLQALATADQTEVLKLWKGLGYNSRALRMRRAAQVIVEKYSGKFPTRYEQILELPGIGPYTAGAISAFAYNKPLAFIETNIRRVYLHHFFADSKNIDDKDLMNFIEETLDETNPREWYFALMDYGSYLGTSLKIDGKKYNPNVKSKHYVKQPKFEGSGRQIRGKILGVLLSQKTHSISFEKLFKELSEISSDRDRMETILEAMRREEFVEIKKGKIFLYK